MSTRDFRSAVRSSKRRAALAPDAPGSAWGAESLQYGVRADRQVTDAGTRGGEDRITDRRTDHGRRRLAEAQRHPPAGGEIHLHVRHLAPAAPRIGVEGGVLPLALYEPRTLMPGQS